MSPTIRAKLNRWTSPSPSGFRVWLVVSILMLGGFYVQTQRDQMQSRHDARARVAIEHRARLAAEHARDDAIRQANAQFAFSINSISCGFRQLAEQQVKRAQVTLDDPASSPSARARARLTIRQSRSFEQHVPVTVPPTYDCRQLSKSSDHPKPATGGSS